MFLMSLWRYLMASLTDVLKTLYQIKFPVDIEKTSLIDGSDILLSYSGYGMYSFYECQKFFLIKGRINIEDILEIENYSGWSRLFLNENKFDLACEEFIQNEDESYFLLKYGKSLLQFKEEKYFSTLKQFLVLSESMSTK